jgi:hypothetical protein
LDKVGIFKFKEIIRKNKNNFKNENFPEDRHRPAHKNIIVKLRLGLSCQVRVYSLFNYIRKNSYLSTCVERIPIFYKWEVYTHKRSQRCTPTRKKCFIHNNHAYIILQHHCHCYIVSVDMSLLIIDNHLTVHFCIILK